MPFFKQKIPIGSSGAPSSDALNTTGFNNNGGLFNASAGGLLSTLLGTGRSDSFYKDFYQNLLTTANAPAMNSLWLVFIQDLPSYDILLNHKDKDNSGMYYSWYQKAAQEGLRPRGIILAQGVIHVGDGTKFPREGYQNTGLWKGILSNGRNDIEQLQISFLETNLSFVDYALRPWAIAVAHEGLTNPLVKANNITVWHLAKMGAGVNFARRKVITYHNCFPTSIDSQEYNYKGDDMAVQRKVSFGFTHYTMENGDDALLNILTYGAKENAMLGFLKDQANQALENVQQQFGADNVMQYINNLVERGKDFATSLVSNTVQGAITNIAGGIQGAVDGAINNLVGRGLTAGVDAVNSISDATNNAIDSITNADHDADTVRGGSTSINTSVNKAVQATSENASNARLGTYGYKEKKIDTDDVVNHVLQNPVKEEEKPAIVDVNKKINENDVPKFPVALVNETPEGGISIPRTFAAGSVDDDTPVFLKNYDLLYYVEKSINTDDTPKFLTALPNSKILAPTTNKAVDATADSNISAVENAFMMDRTINQNDGMAGADLVEYVEKEIPQDDANPSKSVKFTEKQISQEDSNPN